MILLLLFLNLNNFWIGDSIAHGYRQALKENGDTKVGRTPAEIVKVIKNKKDLIKNKTIYLSSGYANCRDVKNIELEIKLLKEYGCSDIFVLGLSETNVSGNKVLKNICESEKIHYIGTFQSGKDGVHPKSYKKYWR